MVFEVRYFMPSRHRTLTCELDLDKPTPNAETYRGFSDLATAQTAGKDFRVIVRKVEGSRIAIIAPHGGGIEQYTS